MSSRNSIHYYGYHKGRMVHLELSPETYLYEDQEVHTIEKWGSTTFANGPFICLVIDQYGNLTWVDRQLLGENDG